MKTRICSVATAALAGRGLAASLVCGVLALLVVASAHANPKGDPIVGPDGNLLVNGNFQAKDGALRPLRWQFFGLKSEAEAPDFTGLKTGLDGIVSQERKHNNGVTPTSPATLDDVADTSLKMMDNSATDGFYMRSEKRLAVAGMQYTASAWVNIDTGTPPSFLLEFWDIKNVRVGMQTVTVPAGSGWQQVTISGTAPSAADADREIVTMHVTVSLYSSVGAKGVSYWDDIVLKPVVAYDPDLAVNTRELFMDDYRLDAAADVERVVHAPVKSEPMISRDQPWERDVVTVTGTVMKLETPDPDGTKFKMWYYSGGTALLAKSPDGNTWTKPNLSTERGTVTAPNYHYYTDPMNGATGSDANNMAFTFTNRKNTDGTSIETDEGRINLVDDKFATDPNKRYKALMFDPRFSNLRGNGYYYFSSPNGISQWLNEGEIFPAGDMSNIAARQVTSLTTGLPEMAFYATTKQRTLDTATMAAFQYDRIAFVSTSRVFGTVSAWHQPGGVDLFAPAVESDQADDFFAQSRRSTEGQIYGMPIYPYPGTRNFVAFPWLFEAANYTQGEFWKAGDGPLYPQVAFTRDLRIWGRPVRAPIIPLGGRGAWDDGTIYTPSGDLMLSDNGEEMFLYFSGSSLGHGGGFPLRYLDGSGNPTSTPTAVIAPGSSDLFPAGKDTIYHLAKATWRRDGFMSFQNAGDYEGFVVTKPIRFTTATKLKINANLAWPGQPAGSLKVEIIDPATGTPKPGFTKADAVTINVDTRNGLVAWAGGSNINAFANQEIQLKFYLQRGDLFSYWLEQ